MEYLNAFLCGGILCAIGQLLIDKTTLTPARILTGYVVAGVLLSALGIYDPIAKWGGAGATVPLYTDDGRAPEVELHAGADLASEQHQYQLRAMLVRELRTMPERGDPDE